MRAFPTLLPALFLAACGGDRTITEINAAAWLEKDSEFLYTYHTFTGHNNGLVRVTSVYSASEIRIYSRRVKADGFTDAVLLYRQDSVLPCGELLYRPAEPAVYLSYKTMDRYNVLDRHFCGDVGEGRDGKRILRLAFRDGKLEPDTAAVADSLIAEELDRSRGKSGEKGLTIDAEYESLCVLGHCISE